MKSLGKLVYIFVFFSSAIYVYKHNKRYEIGQIVDGYTINFSVEQGRDVYFYLNALSENKQAKVFIYNLKNEKVDSVVLHIKPQSGKLNSKAFELGYDYENKLSYNTKGLKSGLYFINNIVPFLVKNTALNDAITVVIPYGNLMALNANGGKSFDPNNSTNGVAAESLSLLKPLRLSRTESVFLNFIDSLYANNHINYISDLDLTNYRNINKSSVLIIYGYSAFWTLEQRKNFDKYVSEGGNVAAFSTYFMNNKYLYDAASQQISFTRRNDSIADIPKRSGIWDHKIYNYPTVQSVGCNYTIKNDLTQSVSMKLGQRPFNLNHPVLKEIDLSLINLPKSEFNSIKLKVIDGKLEADTTSGSFYSKEIVLSFNDITDKNFGGIYELIKEHNKGKLIIVGSDLWIDNDNFKQSEIQKITKNILDFLRT